MSYCKNKGGDVVDDRGVFESRCNCMCFVEYFNGGLGMYLQANVCMCEHVFVCVCQVVINKDRNIGSPAVLTSLRGTFHQSKHSHTVEIKTNLFQPSALKLKLSQPVQK